MANLGDASERRLEGLLSATDSALPSLKIEDLLTDLLKGLRDVSGADAAAVLQLDEGHNDLVGRAACGIEDRNKVTSFVLGLGGNHRSVG